MPMGLKRLFRLVGAVLLILVALLVGFRVRYNDTIRELAQNQVINTTSDLINDAIDVQIETGNIQYERIVYFEKDLNAKGCKHIVE